MGFRQGDTHARVSSAVVPHRGARPAGQRLEPDPGARAGP